jgi:cell division cycle 20-like protein 1 (cofactor of APC complex)
MLQKIWDVTKLKRTRTMGGHRQRVGTQAWSSHMLSSGSRDKSILLRDVRVPEPYVEKLLGHKSEVCGLKVGTTRMAVVQCSFYRRGCSSQQ